MRGNREVMSIGRVRVVEAKLGMGLAFTTVFGIGRAFVTVASLDASHDLPSCMTRFYLVVHIQEIDWHLWGFFGRRT
jgi:hypothetical protein